MHKSVSMAPVCLATDSTVNDSFGHLRLQLGGRVVCCSKSVTL